MRIKVCGLTNRAQVDALDKMGVQFGGFIFYPKSPRYVYNSMTKEEIKKIKGKINKVGVFVNASQEEVLQTVDDCGLYLVQLHGDETPKYCEKIGEYITVIKAFQVESAEELAWRIHEYKDSVDIYLFDTPGLGYGGTGKKFDWKAIGALEVGKPFILSGGIGPKDVAALHRFEKLPIARDLFAVDVNSGFELKPGLKDIGKIETFVQKLNQGNHAS